MRGEKNSKSNSFELLAEIDDYSLLNQFKIENMQTTFEVYENRLSTNLFYLGVDSTNYGKIRLQSSVNSTGHIKTTIEELILANDENDIWKTTEGAEINFEENKLNYSQFSLINKQQELSLDGIVGSKETDELNISLSEFDLSNFGDLTKNNDSEIQLNGVINLELSLKSILNNIEFTGSVLVNQLVLNDIQIGDLTFKSDWEGKNNRFVIEGGLRNEDRVEEINFQSIKYYPFNDVEKDN